jgi:hypothetical protein
MNNWHLVPFIERLRDPRYHVTDTDIETALDKLVDAQVDRLELLALLRSVLRVADSAAVCEYDQHADLNGLAAIARAHQLIDNEVTI